MFFSQPCLTCIVFPYYPNCKERCSIYKKSIKYISMNLGKWDSKTIRKFRKNSTPEFNHEIEEETKRRVEFNETYRIG